jgi:hypothetical protein
MSQRDVMREVWRKYRPDEDAAVRAYARREDSGEVPRASNRYDLSAEQYARALLSDGLRKGWL